MGFYDLFDGLDMCKCEELSGPQPHLQAWGIQIRYIDVRVKMEGMTRASVDVRNRKSSLMTFTMHSICH